MEYYNFLGSRDSTIASLFLIKLKLICNFNSYLQISVFVQSLMHLGSKSFSHSFAAIAKFHPTFKVRIKLSCTTSIISLHNEEHYPLCIEGKTEILFNAYLRF